MLARHLEDEGHFTSRGMAALVAQARASYPEFAAIAIVDPPGRVVASDPPTTEEGRTTAGIDFSGREWFGEILRGRRTLTYPDVEVSAIRQGRPGLPIGAPISDGRGGLRGVVVAWLRLDAIQALTDRIRFDRTGFAQMTTSFGVLLAHERPVHVVERRSLSGLSVWPIVKSQASGQLPLYTGLSGDRRLAGFATVPEVGWKIWVTQGRAEIEADLIATYRRLLGWTLVALLATLALAILVASQVSSPIAALRNTASAIASGDATRKVPQGGPHEVAGLAQAFEEMLGRLTQAQGALESRLAETAALLAIAKVIGGTLDIPEALRRICRELARLTGAGTVAAHLVDSERTRLDPVAAYHVPKHLLETVATTPVPTRRAGLPRDRLRGGPARLDRRCHARPPLRVAALPRVPPPIRARSSRSSSTTRWPARSTWSGGQERRRFDEAEVAVLQAVGRQAGTLLRSARLHAATERQARQATKLYEVAGQLASLPRPRPCPGSCRAGDAGSPRLRRVGHLRVRRGAGRAGASEGAASRSRSRPEARAPPR